MPRISNAHCITHFTPIFYYYPSLYFAEHLFVGKSRKREAIDIIRGRLQTDMHTIRKVSRSILISSLTKKVFTFLQNRKRMNVCNSRKICSTAAMLSSLAEKKSLRNFITKRTESTELLLQLHIFHFLVRPFYPPLNKGKKREWLRLRERGRFSVYFFILLFKWIIFQQESSLSLSMKYVTLKQPSLHCFHFSHLFRSGKRVAVAFFW